MINSIFLLCFALPGQASFDDACLNARFAHYYEGSIPPAFHEYQYDRFPYNRLDIAGHDYHHPSGPPRGYLNVSENTWENYSSPGICSVGRYTDFHVNQAAMPAVCPRCENSDTFPGGFNRAPVTPWRPEAVGHNHFQGGSQDGQLLPATGGNVQQRFQSGTIQPLPNASLPSSRTPLHQNSHDQDLHGHEGHSHGTNSDESLDPPSSPLPPSVSVPENARS